MAGKLVEQPPQYVRSLNPVVADGFHELREAVAQGPLDKQTRELIMVASFATVGYEMPFRNYTTHLKDMKVSKEAVQQAVFLTFGSTTTLNQVALALSWIDDVYDPATV